MSRIGSTWVGAALCAAGAATALGDGFEIETPSTRSLGTANAGRAATADDAAILWWNPAGMTRLRRPHLTYSVTRLDLDATFRDSGTTDLTGAPTSGSRRENGTAPATVPTLYFTYPLDEDVVVGLGVNAPFGLGTNYGETWKGRYHATNTQALLLNVNPAAAFRIDEHWSVGAGVSAQRAQATLANIIDFGTIGASVGLPLRPQGADGRVEVKADNWAFGYDLGVLWEPSAETRLGLAFRSHIDHTLHGDARFNLPPAAQPLTGGGAFLDTRAEAPLSTPAMASLSGYHELCPHWAVVGDVTWIGWDRVSELKVKFSNPAQPTIVQPTDWTDTYRYSVGAIWRPDDDWTFRVGAAATDTPVPFSTREARVPDEDRIWLTFGLSRRLSETVTLDFAYVYLRVIRPAEIDQVNPLAGHLVGDVRWRPVHMFSLGLNVDF